MSDQRCKIDKNKVNTKELNLPETVFIRDIENKVFQSIILQCLSQISGISLVEGNFIDHLLGRSSDGVKGIYAEQNEQNQSVQIKVEVNIVYGTSIPEKAEEIQMKIAEEITSLTGLHVGTVHVIFKNVISVEQANKLNREGVLSTEDSETRVEYPDEF